MNRRVSFAYGFRGFPQKQPIHYLHSVRQYLPQGSGWESRLPLPARSIGKVHLLPSTETANQSRKCGREHALATSENPAAFLNTHLSSNIGTSASLATCYVCLLCAYILPFRCWVLLRSMPWISLYQKRSLVTTYPALSNINSLGRDGEAFRQHMRKI